jgi:hypothetical protein
MTKNHSFLNGYYRKYFSGSRHLSNQKGIALVAGLIFMLLLTLLIFTSIKWASTDITRTNNYTEILQATHIAEAGIHRALNYFNYDASGNSPGEVSNGFDDELVGGADWPTGTFDDIGLGGDGGTYTVLVKDNSDGDSDLTADVDKSVILTSTGIVDGGTAEIEAVIYRPLFKTDNAITTEGSLTINGNPTIAGTNGSVHTNVDLSLTGNPSISETATATGTLTTTGSPTVSGGSSSGAANEDIPTVTISDYLSTSDYVLTSDGRVENPPGTTIHTFSSDGKWSSGGPGCTGGGKGWDYNVGPPVVWDLGDDCGEEGNYYVEGSIKISGNPGSPSDAWDVSLIAEEHIDVSGNPNFDNFQDPADSEDIQNIFMMAGTDIAWSGNPSNSIQGLVYAGEQIEISGNISFNGFIIAADASATDGTVTENKISGNPTITYNGDVVSPFLSSKVSILSWQKT